MNLNRSQHEEHRLYTHMQKSYRNMNINARCAPKLVHRTNHDYDESLIKSFNFLFQVEGEG